MSTIPRWMLLCGVTAPLAACAAPRATQISEEKRIWVIRSPQNSDLPQVYRCADGSGPDQPPKPVCIRAPLVEPQ